MTWRNFKHALTVSRRSGPAASFKMWHAWSVMCWETLLPLLDLKRKQHRSASWKVLRPWLGLQAFFSLVGFSVRFSCASNYLTLKAVLGRTSPQNRMWRGLSGPVTTLHDKFQTCVIPLVIDCVVLWNNISLYSCSSLPSFLLWAIRLNLTTLRRVMAPFGKKRPGLGWVCAWTFSKEVKLVPPDAWSRIWITLVSQYFAGGQPREHSLSWLSNEEGYATADMKKGRFLHVPADFRG